MNFIFISPGFPRTYWNFCERLKQRGVNVLAIGDCPYDELLPQLKSCLTEYFYLPRMENYDQVFRAVAFLSYKHGKIDWIESNNEYWLELDARLREDFNVTTGVHPAQLAEYKSKFAMKKYYAAAGVPTARCHQVRAWDDCQSFIKEIGGYPVFVKPEVGVGAEESYKLCNDYDLRRFLETKPDVPYVMEEFIQGDIYSYDAIFNSRGEPLFENSCSFPPSIADIRNNELECMYCALDHVPPQLRERGRATAKAFGINRRFVHFEFFCLDSDRPGLGKKGDFVGLETNMRPAGGYTPDMMNYAHSCDVYSIWADMVAFDERRQPQNPQQYYCVYAARRDKYLYLHSHEEILSRYGMEIKMCERMPEVLAPDMGNQMYTARVIGEDAANEFIDFVLTRAE